MAWEDSPKYFRDAVLGVIVRRLMSRDPDKAAEILGDLRPDWADHPERWMNDTLIQSNTKTYTTIAEGLQIYMVASRILDKIQRAGPRRPAFGKRPYILLRELILTRREAFMDLGRTQRNDQRPPVCS